LAVPSRADESEELLEAIVGEKEATRNLLDDLDPAVPLLLRLEALGIGVEDLAQKLAELRAPGRGVEFVGHEGGREPVRVVSQQHGRLPCGEGVQVQQPVPKREETA